MRFHTLYTNITPPSKFTFPYCYEPHPLCKAAAAQLIKHIISDRKLQHAAEQGKMFGVLVVRNGDGELGFLAAYSGTTCYDFDNTYFVPAVYDYLNPEGFFKKGEHEISDINRQIEEIENSCIFRKLHDIAEKAEADAMSVIDDYRKSVTDAKLLRDKKRMSGCTPEEEALMRKESSFMKAEMKRLKTRLEHQVSDQQTEYKKELQRLENLKKLRREKSDALQEKLFRHFEMADKDGNKKNVCEIFKEQGAGIPPAGTGECCAPKMIQYAHVNGYKLVAMAEFWYGSTPAAEIRHHLHYYPSCLSKCRPLLTYMLRGIETDADPLKKNIMKQPETVYEDENIIVINKPSGLLSVNGRGDTCSAESILQKSHSGMFIKAVHRLDMDTSGLLMFAKNEESYKIMQKMFAERKVKKRYTAVVEGVLHKRNGRISLPLMPDYLNRPMQKADRAQGREAVTSYRVIGENAEHTRTRLSLIPVTGRTHQLRVHCAHPEGLNAPIVGDNLYGTPGGRLMLHASYLEFTHPVTNNIVSFKSDPDF